MANILRGLAAGIGNFLMSSDQKKSSTDDEESDSSEVSYIQPFSSVATSAPDTSTTSSTANEVELNATDKETTSVEVRESNISATSVAVKSTDSTADSTKDEDNDDNNGDTAVRAKPVTPKRRKPKSWAHFTADDTSSSDSDDSYEDQDEDDNTLLPGTDVKNAVDLTSPSPEHARVERSVVAGSVPTTMQDPVSLSLTFLGDGNGDGNGDDNGNDNGDDDGKTACNDNCDDKDDDDKILYDSKTEKGTIGNSVTHLVPHRQCHTASVTP